jgi:hypothetical protein
LVHVDKIRSLRHQCNLGKQKCHESLDPSALPHCLIVLTGSVAH